jgi:type I restriction enzyme R subunit
VFRTKALSFLKEHQGEAAVRKIHQNWPITADDMVELQRILIDSGVGTPDDFDRARKQAGSFGLFIRSLVGLDRVAAQEAFGRFLAKQDYNANQINFVNLIISDLAQNGVISAARFYDAPYTGISATGPQGLFTPEQIEELDQVLDAVRRNADVA